MLRKFETIPFLNGGLFECLDKKDEDNDTIVLRVDGFSDRKDNKLSIPNYLFFSDEKEVDLNKAYGTRNKRYKVRGLIEILRRYKFTITENTPIEEEVALDPELLGKVFENLLAAYNPETRTTARKQTGSYYTPREIVNYMVDESLIAYLKNKLIDYHITQSPDIELNDKQKSKIETKLRHLVAYNDEQHKFKAAETELLINAIDTLKILDPACGSGAFPMGILQKLVFILSKLDPDNDQWKQRQIDKVENTIKAAEDIDDSTIRENTIAELEAEIDNINNAFTQNQLDYGRKLYLIENCIYGVDKQPIAAQISRLRFFISLVVDQRIDDTKENRGVRPLPNIETNFIAANTLLGITGQLPFRSPEIIEKEQELDDVRRRIFTARTPKTKDKYRSRYTEIRQEICKLLIDLGLERGIAGKIASWDPYDQNKIADWYNSERMFGIMDGFDIVIGNPPYIKEYTDKKAFDGLRDSPYYKGKMDIWYMFACEGLDLVKEGQGLVTYIAQNNWITSDGASKMRNKVIQDAQILSLVDFGSFKIFSSGIQTMIMAFKRNIDIDNYPFDYRRLLGKDLNINDVTALLNRDQNNRAEYINPIIKRSKYTNTTLTFNHPKVELVLNNISLKRDFTLNKNEIVQGIVPNPDVVSEKSLNLIPNHKVKKLGLSAGDSVFVIPKGFLPNLSVEEKDYIKPVYEPTDLSKYFIPQESRKDIIYLTKENWKLGLKTLMEHLDKYREIMEARRENINGKRDFFHLHWPRNEMFFQEGAKILSVRKCDIPTFVYTDIPAYVMMAINIIKTKRINLKYLTGILNSKLVTFWLKHRGKMQGTNYQIDKQPLLSIPLISPPSEEQIPIANLVDQILAAKRADSDADISDLEDEIDKLVYDLYGLTKEEIAIVKESA